MNLNPDIMGAVYRYSTLRKHMDYVEHLMQWYSPDITLGDLENELDAKIKEEKFKIAGVK